MGGGLFNPPPTSKLRVISTPSKLRLRENSDIKNRKEKGKSLSELYRHFLGKI